MDVIGMTMIYYIVTVLQVLYSRLMRKSDHTTIVAAMPPSSFVDGYQSTARTSYRHQNILPSPLFSKVSPLLLFPQDLSSHVTDVTIDLPYLLTFLSTNKNLWFVCFVGFLGPDDVNDRMSS